MLMSLVLLVVAFFLWGVEGQDWVREREHNRGMEILLLVC